MAQTPPAALVSLIERVRDFLASLRRRLAPGHASAMELVGGFWAFHVVYVLADLGVADDLSAGPCSAEELGRRKGVSADAMYRLLRCATAAGVFREISDRRFELNAAARALRSDEPQSARDFIVFMGKYGARHWAQLGECARDGRTASEILYGMKPFEAFGSDPEGAALFNAAMTSISSFVVGPVVAAYDFSGAHTVVDVAGGHGRLLGGILEANPSLRGILFDLPEVVEGAAQTLSRLGVAERCEIVGGSFFDEGAVPAGDLYVMKAIIHDWPDEPAGKILANIRSSMQPGASLLLCENVVPAPNRSHLAKFLDIEMLVQSGGRERTELEYSRLFESAGFKLSRVVPTASPASIIEAKAA